ncbi:MAG: hypothetical protein DWQ04_21135 [Chloroflexi bacterium]|nr:MAG: hypothetical protein DWQ04_21135 [Chloroflexota bacterium]
MSEPIFVTLLVIDELERLGVPYLIGGSFASTAYGRVRTTQDVDIVAKLEQKQVDNFVASLGTSFYADEAMIRNAITRRSSFNLIHLETMFKVDIFLPKNRSFDQQQLERRTKRIIDKTTSREVYFATPEDTILAKLEWYRLGGETSERQWQDIRGIFQQRSDLLDIAYLKQSAQALKVTYLLERMLTEI